jgi:hypothetical protein
MSELERRLSSLAGEVEWPPSPDLASGVTAAVREAPPARRRPLVRALALAALISLLLAGAVLAAVPDLRHRVLHAFGLHGATVEKRKTLPSLPETRDLDLGPRLTLRDAARSVRFRPLLPALSGQPDALHVRVTTPGGELAAAYRPRSGLPAARPTGLGLLVTEFRGDLHPDYVGKIAGQATRIERLRVGRFRAVWITGAPHLFFYRLPDGRMREDSLRLAANVLLVERGRLLVRLEGAFSRARALALALSLEPLGTIPP